LAFSITISETWTWRVAESKASVQCFGGAADRCSKGRGDKTELSSMAGDSLTSTISFASNRGSMHLTQICREGIRSRSFERRRLAAG